MNERFEYFEFKKNHPEVNIGLIEAAFRSCTGRAPKSIEEAWKHVQKCGWCKKYIENHKKVEKSGVLISKVADWQVGRY